MEPIPYATQWIEDDDIAAVVAALRSPYLTQGPLINEFEEKAASLCGAGYAVAVNSGTAALHLACLAAGLSSGDELITSPLTFAASANCALFCGARPVFADIEAETAAIDPAEIEKNITKRTKMIIPVHYAGNPCELEEIYRIAQRKNLIVVEDAAHALGAEYKGAKVGSGKYSAMTILSFHPVKHIATGEGGMVLTNDKGLYEKLKLYRSHGITRDKQALSKDEGPWYYEMQALGYNYRLTDIQSALGISQLKKLDRFVARRREIARRYDKAFAGAKGVTTLKETPGALSSHHLYMIQVADRKNIFEKLRSAGVLVNVHYIPVYLMPYYQQLGYQAGACPRAEAFYQKAITLPLFPKMTDEQVDYVIAKTLETVK